MTKMKKKLFIVIIMCLVIGNVFSQATYTSGYTEYYYDQYYKTTGKPKVKRSQANKQAFLRSRGYSETPYGYEIDHIIPLSQGGSDSPYNMQLLTVRQHRIKTARERRYYSTSSYSTTPIYSPYIPTYTPPETYYSTSTYCPPAPSFEITRERLTPPPLPSLPVSTYIPVYQSSSYANLGLYSGRILYTGSRGGTFYINSNGNKTYVKN